MSAYTFRSSRPTEWVLPRPHRDAHQRYLAYGPIQSMREPSFLERVFGRA